ncbi:MAG: rhodanese-like domain-containing protein [Sulfitobacter sp.]
MQEDPPSGTKTPRRVTTRRGVLLGVAVLSGTAAARWYNIGADITKGTLTVQDAHAAATQGSITLIDIRRPDEWARTGVGLGALPIDMRDTDFVAQLLTHVGGKDAPIALICARGVRSRGLSKRLASAGFTHIIDVPEGMLGSGAGPGWLGAGLPVTPS